MTSLGICTDGQNCHEVRNAIVSGILILAITLLNSLPSGRLPTIEEFYSALRLACIAMIAFYIANKTINKGAVTEAKDVPRKAPSTQVTPSFFQKLKPNAFSVALLMFASALFVWSIWQHELLVNRFLADMWNTDFAFFWGIHAIWGFAYDFTLIAEFIAFVLPPFAVWFWKESP
jgi:hypothetical protein